MHVFKFYVLDGREREDNYSAMVWDIMKAISVDKAVKRFHKRYNKGDYVLTDTNFNIIADSKEKL